MKLWLTGNGYVENTKNMKKYRNVCTNVEIFGENTKTFAENKKKRWRRPWNCQKPEMGMLNSQKFHQISKIFHRMPKYLVKIRKYSPNSRNISPNSEKFHQISKNFGKMLKNLVKFRNIW